MAYWLLKSEPNSWSWDDQKREKTDYWDGVRNAQAQKNLKSMRLGDQAFFYHSGKMPHIIGICEIVRTFYPEPESPQHGMVDIKVTGEFSSPIFLSQIKNCHELGHLSFLRQPRLSVCPIDPSSWTRLCAMGGIIKPL